MNMNERISRVISYSKLSPSEFADEIEVQRSSISHITSGRNKPSLDFLIKVKEVFPELSWDWLINGDGEMLIVKDEPEEIKKSEPTSLPDLFSIISDDNFGNETETEDRILARGDNLSEKPITVSKVENTEINDSQQLGNNPKKQEISQVISKNVNVEEQKKIVRIVLFYENGKFESFEP